MILEGEVVQVKFRNEENGYSIVIVDTGLTLATCVGYFTEVFEGQTLVMDGEWIVNQKFGEQFEVQKSSIRLPSSRYSMIVYLASGLFHGIKTAIATRIVDTFQDKTMEVLATDPKKLSTVKGITYKKAKEIVAKFNSLKDMQEVVMYLQSYEITMSNALKLYKAYGQNTKAILEDNPYQIIDDIEGIGFKTADNIAIKLGIDVASEFRVKAGVYYTINEYASQNGHTYLPYKELIIQTSQLLGLESLTNNDLIETCIKRCEAEGSLRIIEYQNDYIVMSDKLYRAEKFISKKIVKLINSSSNNILADLDLDIKNYQEMNKIELDSKQIDAIKNSMMYGVSIITGGPGTGKTTIIKAIISLLQLNKKTFKLCAPTGRASKRLTEATGYSASTIHRLLGLTYIDGTLKFTYDEVNRLSCDVVIVDEVSMCDVFLMKALVSALKNNARIIFVGDKDQLPSVGPGNVLSDMINSKVIPISYLSRIYRQGDKSMISVNAHSINEGMMIKLDNKSSDFFFTSVENPNKVADVILNLVKGRIQNYFKVDLDDIQILSPAKKGYSGVDELNRRLQFDLNPPRQEDQELKYGDTIFRIGDKIIHTKNNYDLEYFNPDGTSDRGIFNGEMGKIIDVDPKAPTITVQFEDDKIAIYDRTCFDELQLAYAITVHKSQGSEFKVVIMVVLENNSMLATRNLLYTGVTRGKKAVVLVGGSKNVAKMIANNIIRKRNSMLKVFLQEEYTFRADEQ